MRFAAAGALAFLLAACSAGSSRDERLGKFLVAPGKYRLYDCVQLSQESAAIFRRERELREAKAKAEAAPGGGFVSAVAYDAEYGQVRGNLDEMRREAAEKNCPPLQPPPPGVIGRGQLR